MRQWETAPWHIKITSPAWQSDIISREHPTEYNVQFSYKSLLFYRSCYRVPCIQLHTSLTHPARYIRCLPKRNQSRLGTFTPAVQCWRVSRESFRHFALYSFKYIKILSLSQFMSTSNFSSIAVPLSILAYFNFQKSSLLFALIIVIIVINANILLHTRSAKICF